MKKCLPVTHHWNVSIARINEEAAQVTMFHVGQNYQRDRQRTVLLSLKSDTFRTTVVRQVSQYRAGSDSGTLQTH